MTGALRLSIVVTVVALVAMVLVDLLLGRSIPGFYALFGLVSCVVIVVVSKEIGKRGLQRDEGYYVHQGDR